MALDGGMMHLIGASILKEAEGARIEKVHMPTKNELIFSLRGNGVHKSLLISSLASSARIHFTDLKPQNPANPPMFCMLLRKHLGGGKLTAVRQVEMDRVLFLDFLCRNELGDQITNTLAVEVMGRHSNIILLDETGKIIDSIKRVGLDMSSVRQILPGGQYVLPPKPTAQNLLTADIEALSAEIMSEEIRTLSKRIAAHVMGLSPIIAREIAFQVEVLGQPLTQALLSLKACLVEEKDMPTVIFTEDNRLFDYTFLDIKQYGGARTKRYFENYHAMLDFYFVEQTKTERVRSRSGELVRAIQNMIARTEKKIALQKGDILKTETREEWRLHGDLLTSNLHAMQSGMKEITLVNYYDENMAELTIPLDIRKSPAENAQSFYKRYRKAETARVKLAEQITLANEELIYLESVLDSLMRSSSEEEIAAIRSELTAEGYLKKRSAIQSKRKKEGFFQYESPDGFTILVGRNNEENDLLTFKKSKKQDIWLHVKDIPGSHTLILTEGNVVSTEALQIAAEIAAYHSKGRGSSKIPVDYTEVRYVKKPHGAKPGRVIYTNQKTLYVTPDGEKISTYEKKKLH